MQKKRSTGLWRRSAKLISGSLLLLLCMQGAAEPRYLGNITGSYIPENFLCYWNQVTSENAAKWASVESTRDTFNWSGIDRDYNFAKAHGIPYKFHTLIWGSAGARWWQALSASEMREEIEEWISAVGNRYNADMIDVVNEPLHAPPVFRDALGGDGETGWDWVITAFELANRYCGGVKLINEYGIINDRLALGKYLEIIHLLQERDLIDGIGIECHCFSIENTDAATIKANLDLLAGAGLPIYISELDISGNDQQQLAQYREKFPVFYNHTHVHGITLWGYIKGQTWKELTDLVDSGEPGAIERPAMQWLKPYLGAPPGPLETAPPYPELLLPTPEATVPPTPTPLPGQGTLRFSPGTLRVLPGQNFSMDLYLNTGNQDLASYDITVHFGANLIKPDTAQANGGIEAGSDGFITSVNQETFTIRIRGSSPQTAGPGSELHLLRLHWQSFHCGWTNMPIDIHALKDSAGNTIGVPGAETGKVYIDFPDGDVNHDGKTDITDALMTAHAAVGDDFLWLRDYPEADGDCDGRLTIIDALIIARIAVGLLDGFPCPTETGGQSLVTSGPKAVP